ncbi:hypothetical protein [Rhizobium leguminosarum]
MAPEYLPGQALVFSKSEPWQTGDPVLLFRRPEFLAPGENQFCFKQLLSAPSPSFWSQPGGGARHARANFKPLVMVRMWNPLHVITFDAEHLYGIHKLVGVVGADKLAGGVTNG